MAADLAATWSGVLQLSGCGLADTPRAVGTDPRAVATLAAHSEEWAERFPGARAGASFTADIGKAFRDAIRAICGEQDVVLFVDDAHWLDAESLRALQAVLRDLSESPLFLLVSAFRRSDAQTWMR